MILILQQGNTQKDFSNKLQHRVALYVGPAHNTPGAIRAAVQTSTGVQIVTTSKFTAATEGGGLLGIHEIIQKGVSLVINSEDITAQEQEQLHGVIFAPATGPGKVKESSWSAGTPAPLAIPPVVPPVVPICRRQNPVRYKSKISGEQGKCRSNRQIHSKRS